MTMKMENGVMFWNQCLDMVPIYVYMKKKAKENSLNYLNKYVRYYKNN